MIGSASTAVESEFNGVGSPGLHDEIDQAKEKLKSIFNLPELQFNHVNLSKSQIATILRENIQKFE